jgi:hypothetical protein
MGRVLRGAVVCASALCALVACDVSVRPGGPSPDVDSTASPAAANGASIATTEPRAATALRHDVFVWQRVWSPEVWDAVSGADADLSRILVLVEEIEWTKASSPFTRPSSVDLSRLASLHRPIGLAFRIGLPPDGYRPEMVDQAVAAVQRARIAAAATGLVPAELHLDVDMPTSRLADYASWFPRVRAAWPGVPVTITGLPTWLPDPALPTLLDAVDGWVLQVHWLRPVGAAAGAPCTDRQRCPKTLTLMDDAETDTSIAAASALGRPFRVALPTYTSAGVRAEPERLAKRVQALREAPPAAFEGIAWFRLPVRGNADTWTDVAFEAVRAGRVPPRTARAWTTPSDEEAAPGTLDVHIEADGEDEVENPCVRVRWQGGPPLAADSIATGLSAADGDARWSFMGMVRPGDAPRTLGWIRLPPGVRVDAVEVLRHWDCVAGRDLPPADG